MHALTQEELLVEAAETELVNTASLARLIAVEEEVWLSARLCNSGPVPAAALPRALSKRGCLGVGHLFRVARSLIRVVCRAVA